MLPRLLRLGALSAALFASATGLLAQSSPTAPLSPALVPITTEPLTEGINIPEASIDSAFGLLEILTGRTVLRASSIPANTPFSLVIKQSVTPAEALLAIETTMSMNGVAVAPLGERFIKVVPIGSARMEAPELIEGSTLKMPPSGRIATKLFTFEFVRVEQFAGKIANLFNAQLGGVVTFEQANALLVTDSISTLQRVEILVQQLDQPNISSLEPKFYPLVFTKASDLANKIRSILQGPAQQQLGTGTTFSADDTTNQLIVISDPRLHPFFDRLIGKLDVRSNPNTRNEVIPLKHAEATEVASLVSQLVSGQNQATSRAEGASRRNAGATQTVQAAQPAQPNAAVAAAAAQAGVSTNEFSELVTVLADERSNAVVVSGTVEDIRLIKELVNKIDIVLAQVRIEVVIAEVGLTDNDATGISSLNLVVNEGKLVGFDAGFVGGALGKLGDLVGEGTDAASVIARNYATFSGWDLNSIISLGNRGSAEGTGKTRTNIISSPAVMTTHNKEAHIFVGSSRPTISGYIPDSSTTGVSSLGRTTVGNTEIGITLTVKPLIGNDGSVQLEIKQETSSVIGSVNVDDNEQPIIGKREMESFVTARNGDILVLGGLQSSTDNRTRQRFGPIPFISDLLGSRSKSVSKTDLLIFLRPVVLTNSTKDNESAFDRLGRSKISEPVNRALEGLPLQD